jgi:hypothetical protein
MVIYHWSKLMKKTEIKDYDIGIIADNILKKSPKYQDVVIAHQERVKKSEEIFDAILLHILKEDSFATGDDEKGSSENSHQINNVSITNAEAKRGFWLSQIKVTRGPDDHHFKFKKTLYNNCPENLFSDLLSLKNDQNIHQYSDIHNETVKDLDRLIYEGGIATVMTVKCSTENDSHHLCRSKSYWKNTQIWNNSWMKT